MSQATETYATVGEDELPLMVSGDAQLQTVDGGALATVTSIVAVQSIALDLTVTSGVPGRTHLRTFSMTGPANASAFAVLSTINCAFVQSNGTTLTERPLGQVRASLSFPNPNPNRVVNLNVRLTDSNQDDPIAIAIRGLVVYWR